MIMYAIVNGLTDKILRVYPNREDTVNFMQNKLNDTPWPFPDGYQRNRKWPFPTKGVEC